MAKLFGTDGIRGLANDDLTPELAFKLGRAAGYIFKQNYERTTVIIGRDTRLSGSMLEGALAAGFCSAGVDIYKAGVIPTPAVAYLARTLGASAGAVISASHNPAPDNGIKFFNSQGFKLADELEERIETLIEAGVEKLPRATGSSLGRIISFDEAEDLYIKYLKSIVKTDLQGIKIVLDCANGAAYHVAPRILQELGAQVISLFDIPDGLNINDNCGSTHPEALQEAVLRFGAHLGLAHDGDADRLIVVDEQGQLLDGDQTLVICGLFLQEKQLLKDKIVVTVMSNLGLKQAFEKANVTVYETKVGDRFVLEKMQEIKAVLGGEQSGHIIFLEESTTGDGILTALKLLEVLKEKGEPLSVLARQMKVLPQILINVRVKDKVEWDKNQQIQSAIKEGEKLLSNTGRVLVRASGTEPLIRVMAEGEDEEQLEIIVGQIADVITEELG